MITHAVSSDRKWGPMQLLKKILSGKNVTNETHLSCDETINERIANVLNTAELIVENAEHIIRSSSTPTDGHDYYCPLLISSELKMFLTQLAGVQHHIMRRYNDINSTINTLIELDEKQRRNTQAKVNGHHR